MNELRAEAEAILRGGLYDALAAHGDVVAHGSYALDLMVWRDLDIYLALHSFDVNAFFALGGAIAALLKPEKMHFRNELIAQSPDLPHGLYWGVYAGEWKIDVWGVTRDDIGQLMQYENDVARRLTPETREAILAIKTAVHTHPQYRKTFGAKAVYDAVLDAGVRDATEFARRIGITLSR